MSEPGSADPANPFSAGLTSAFSRVRAAAAPLSARGARKLSNEAACLSLALMAVGAGPEILDAIHGEAEQALLDALPATETDPAERPPSDVASFARGAAIGRWLARRVRDEPADVAQDLVDTLAGSVTASEQAQLDTFLEREGLGELTSGPGWPLGQEPLG